MLSRNNMKYPFLVSSRGKKMYVSKSREKQTYSDSLRKINGSKVMTISGMMLT